MLPDPEFVAFLREQALAGPGETGDWQALTGGVSSDIWHVRTSRGQFCIKRALAQLKVAAQWTAPVERNQFEWAYMVVADRIAPGAAPAPVAHDPARGLFAMAWLAPEDYPLWKAELLAGRVDPGFAGAVGDLVGRIHRSTADSPDIAAAFATDAAFHALRIEAYLLATAAAHPDLAPLLESTAQRTATTRLALVHGDVSPKNILVGPGGPVLLDAECAWYGDPAFDLAFCLTHLTIKARVVANAAARLVQAFDALTDSYLAQVDWEAPAELETRASALLAGLALARVDGKSPVEYLDEAQRTALRTAARRAVAAQSPILAATRDLLLSRL